MRNLLVSLRRIGAVVGLAFVATLVVHAQGGPPSPEGKTAEQFYKNIKVLNGTPADQLVQSMHLIKGALGVDCEYCHEETDRAADTKKPKEVARKMIQMMMDINKNSFMGKQEVTCYTCHRGRPEPQGVLALPLTEPEEEPQIALPSADQILAKYVEALGGEQALRKVTSRVITGTQDIPTGPGGGVPMPAVIEHDEKAPNLSVNIYHAPMFTVADGFDGTTAWAQNQQGRVISANALDQERAKRNADFYEPLDLKTEYAQIRVTGMAKVNGHDTYVVVATPQGDLPERLYFDALTGLLVRKRTVLPTPVGNSPFQVDYEDYRDTGSGVKFPYVIRMDPSTPRTVPGGTATLLVTKVQDNAPIDDAKFAKPESKPRPAR